MPSFKTYLLASALALSPAGAMAQTAERVVPLPEDPVPKFLTLLSDDGFVDGRSDAIPELTEEAVIAFFGERRMRILNDDPLADQLMTALGGPPFDQIDLGNGYYVSVACSIGNCGERGAVLTQPDPSRQPQARRLADLETQSAFHVAVLAVPYPRARDQPSGGAGLAGA